MVTDTERVKIIGQYLAGNGADLTDTQIRRVGRELQEIVDTKIGKLAQEKGGPKLPRQRRGGSRLARTRSGRV